MHTQDVWKYLWLIVAAIMFFIIGVLWTESVYAEEPVHKVVIKTADLPKAVFRQEAAWMQYAAPSFVADYNFNSNPDCAGRFSPCNVNTEVPNNYAPEPPGTSLGALAALIMGIFLFKRKKIS